jgi:hypothetical protein
MNTDEMIVSLPVVPADRGCAILGCGRKAHSLGLFPICLIHEVMGNESVESFETPWGNESGLDALPYIEYDEPHDYTYGDM